MKITQCGNQVHKELEPGDIIVCQGIKATISSITFQEYWGDDEGFYSEFIDTNGIYRNWKQWTDGGYVLLKGVMK